VVGPLGGHRVARQAPGGEAARQEVPRSRERTPLPVDEGRAPAGGGAYGQDRRKRRPQGGGVVGAARWPPGRRGRVRREAGVHAAAGGRGASAGPVYLVGGGAVVIFLRGFAPVGMWLDTK